MRVGVAVTQVSDEQLVWRASRSDGQAFRELYRRYVSKVRGLLYQMMSDIESLDDLTQEVFVKVFKALPGFRGDAQFSTWLFRIAVNCCQDARRRRARRPMAVPIDNLPLAARGEDPLGRLDREQLVSQALATLKEEHRDVVILHDLHDRPQDEIAKLLNVPVGTVKSRLFYARRQLREWFYARGIEL
ncbi:sigma-70 family RNA polymerase sigma factor [Gloeobacter violaceus]|uniref:Glr3584 protein n=2 Tax=Gloeobacter TaxID=33071 RepID=Q7NFE2_GLOVI|nr:sigma-70 family RNA polymerase sigma factor [Gloeobacter violaceus]UFP95013.1 sigma-70 family RNA polymerase sigma factor [Gloeobacter morelensis MG652769]BAC91525.1 glr3584 [Gloeobacter violaceus PCC 7421]